MLPRPSAGDVLPDRVECAVSHQQEGGHQAFLSGIGDCARVARILRQPPPLHQESSVHLVIFGLTISSSWGNGHATLWRGLCRSLVRRGHRVTFFERDVPYYAAHRDLIALDGVQIVMYGEWSGIRSRAIEQ